MAARDSEFRSGRPFLSAVEAIGELADTHLHVAIDTATRLQPAVLHAALRALSREVPELASRPIMRRLRSVWVREADPRWDVSERTVEAESQARAEEDALFALPFEASGTMPVRLRALHLPDRDRLLLRVSHHLGDGGGTKNLCYRLAAAYRQLRGGPPAQAIQPPAEPILRLLRCMHLSRVPGLLYGLFEAARGGLPARLMTVPMSAGHPGTARFEVLHVPAARVDALRARWGRDGVTLNDVAVAALSRAVEACFPEANPAGARVRLVVTTDLRRYEDQPRDVSNFSALRPLCVGKTPLPPPEEHVAGVVRATRRWKRGLTGLLPGALAILPLPLLPDAWSRWLFLRALGILIGTGGSVSLTNIGPIEASLLDFGDGPCLAARVLPPVARPPLLICALSGCAGALDLSISFRDRALSPEAARRLASAFDGEMASLEAQLPPPA